MSLLQLAPPRPDRPAFGPSAVDRPFPADVDGLYAEWREALRLTPADALRVTELGKRIVLASLNGRTPAVWADPEQKHLRRYFAAWVRRTLLPWM